MTTAFATETQETLEFPYKRSLGPVVGEFLTGLKSARIMGIRDTRGRVLVPPLEFDPVTAERLDEFVEVGSEGTITSWSWVREPLPTHRLQRPFAFAMIRLDGADSDLLHLVDAGTIERMSTGMRVKARWRPDRSGHMNDIEAFEPVAEEDDGDGRVRLARQLVSLDFWRRMSPTMVRFAERLFEGRITGHRCSSCGQVYVPPKGFCPICAVATEDEVDLEDRGTVVSFTIVTPIQYYGQQKTETYALASILLDGADSTLGQQEIGEIPVEEVRPGLRVGAVWRPEEERSAEGMSDRGRGNVAGFISHWRPTGEPDASPETYEEHSL